MDLDGSSNCTGDLVYWPEPQLRALNQASGHPGSLEHKE